MRTVSKLLAFFLALSIFAFGATALALAQSQKRLAFVIGNAAYPSGALATPANDAGLIAQTLQAAGFDVVGARDVDQESLRGAYRDFLAKVTAAGPDAVVFVYLAGQGLQFEGENYFAPIDAQIANAADVPMAAVRVSDLTKKHSEVIVDTVFKSIIDALHRGEKIELRGFGSFRLRKREPRKGRNPKTGDKVDVPPKKVPYFKPGKELKELINREPDAPAAAGGDAVAV